MLPQVQRGAFINRVLVRKIHIQLWAINSYLKKNETKILLLITLVSISCTNWLRLYVFFLIFIYY